jgi:hypothetical protein
MRAVQERWHGEESHGPVRKLWMRVRAGTKPRWSCNLARHTPTVGVHTTKIRLLQITVTEIYLKKKNSSSDQNWNKGTMFLTWVLLHNCQRRIDRSVQIHAVTTYLSLLVQICFPPYRCMDWFTKSYLHVMVKYHWSTHQTTNSYSSHSDKIFSVNTR